MFDPFSHYFSCTIFLGLWIEFFFSLLSVIFSFCCWFFYVLLLLPQSVV